MGVEVRPSVIRRGFVLLEVLVSIVIIAVAMVALLKGFVVALDTLKKIRLNETSVVLARTLMDDMILEPPDEGSFKGNFSDDGRFGENYKDWKWEMEVEADEPEYRKRPRGKLTQDLERVYTANLRIIHEDQFGARTMINLNTILMDQDIYSATAIQGNQLF